MLQADEPDDFVIATGTEYSVEDFLGFAFQHVGLDWKKHVKFDERYLRPPKWMHSSVIRQRRKPCLVGLPKCSHRSLLESWWMLIDRFSNMKASCGLIGRSHPR